MANRMIWNGTAYFGAGAIKSIPEEAARRGFKKALIVTDKDLIKFGVAKKYLTFSKRRGLPMRYSTASSKTRRSRMCRTV